MQFPIVETNCTFTHEGRDYTSGGAFFDLDHGGCLYAIGDANSDFLKGMLTTWSGEYVGWYRQTGKYRNNFGARIACIQATIRGREYYGRYGSDWSQLVRLRPRKTA